LYSIYNEKTKSIDDIWVNGELRLSFRRTFKDKMMQIWDELLDVVGKLIFNEEPDTLIWCCNNYGVHSSQSFYMPSLIVGE
jgi:hypothetical protein